MKITFGPKLAKDKNGNFAESSPEVPPRVYFNWILDWTEVDIQIA